MALVEIVFEVEPQDEPLCRFTREHKGARAMLRVLEAGEERLQAILTVAGASDEMALLARELRSKPGMASFEIVSVTPYSIAMKLGTRPGTKEPLPFARAIHDILQAFGHDTVLEPLLVEGGRLRIHAIVVQPLTTRGALEKLQGLQRQHPWRSFRVVRVNEVDPVAMSDRFVPILDPDQDELVRLSIGMGYYESPRRCNLEDISRSVGLSVSPVHKKLKDIEHLLINVHLDPQARLSKRRRRVGARLARQQNGTLFREVILHATVPGALSEFTAKHAEARVILQPLQDQPGGSTSQLVVAIAKPELAERLMERLHAEGRTLEVLSRDEAHVSLRIETAEGGRDPLVRLARRFGRDAYLKPVVAEEGRLLIRLVLMRRVPEAEIVKALEAVAIESGWREHEVVAVRDLSLEASLLGHARSEKVTARQEEVLRIAHALGYYRTPRGCTLEEIAATLGISTNAVHKNLTAAEQKIIHNYVSNST